MKAYFVTALHHEVFDGVFKWLLSEVGREEAGVSLGNSSSNTAIQRNSLFWTDVMSLMHNIFRDSKFWSNISKSIQQNFIWFNSKKLQHQQMDGTAIKK